jgi:hypothetical protein
MIEKRDSMRERENDTLPAGGIAMQTLEKTAVLFVILSAALLAGCSSVTFTPVEGGEELPPKPKGFEVQVTDSAPAGYRMIGVVSCQDSASSSIWNWWTDQYVLIEEMKVGNLERLLKKVRKVGGEALIGLSHDVMVGGSSGGVGVGVGTGTGGVGVGVGTSLLSGSPKIYVLSRGDVGVRENGAE